MARSLPDDSGVRIAERSGRREMFVPGAAMALWLAVVCAAAGGGEAVHEGKTGAEWARDIADDDERLRTKAFSALCKLGPKAATAVPVLTKQLSHENEMVRWWAAYTLGRIGSPSRDAIPALVETLNDDKEDARVRVRAAVALGMIRQEPEKVIPELERQLDAPDDELRRAAVGGLALFGAKGRKAVPVLIRMLGASDTGTLLSATQDLGLIGPAAGPAVPALTELLRDKRQRVRRRAALALGRIGAAAESSVPSLLGLLRSERKDDRFTALVALGGIGPAAREAIAPVAAAMKDSDTRTAAAQTLVKIGPDVVPEVRKVLATDDTGTLYAALYVLGSLGAAARTAAPDVEKLVSHADEELASQARATLNRIGSDKQE